MVTKRDCDALQVEAARSVMLELTHLLGEYHDDMVVGRGYRQDNEQPYRFWRMVYNECGI